MTDELRLDFPPEYAPLLDELMDHLPAEIRAALPAIEQLELEFSEVDR